MINSSVNRKTARKRFSIDDRVQIHNFLSDDVLQQVLGELDQAPFNLVYVLDDKIQTTSREKMDSMSVQDKQAINQHIAMQAAEGVGFLYGSCHMGVGRPDNLGAGMTALFDFIQSEEMLDFMRTVTSDKSIAEATGHYTKYQPGHFLTRHRDMVENERRLFAYVLNFTGEWHPDWGGLLQFYEEDGTPRNAWSPTFNTLNVFDVRHIHAVTYVTPFAKAPRLSLTGWFNAANRN